MREHAQRCDLDEVCMVRPSRAGPPAAPVLRVDCCSDAGTKLSVRSPLAGFEPRRCPARIRSAKAGLGQPSVLRPTCPSVRRSEVRRSALTCDGLPTRPPGATGPRPPRRRIARRQRRSPADGRPRDAECGRRGVRALGDGLSHWRPSWLPCQPASRGLLSRASFAIVAFFFPREAILLRLVVVGPRRARATYSEAPRGRYAGSR